MLITLPSDKYPSYKLNEEFLQQCCSAVGAQVGLEAEITPHTLYRYDDTKHEYGHVSTPWFALRLRVVEPEGYRDLLGTTRPEKHPAPKYTRIHKVNRQHYDYKHKTIVHSKRTTLYRVHNNPCPHGWTIFLDALFELVPDLITKGKVKPAPCECK